MTSTVSAATAARLCGVGRTTIMRRLAADAIPGATQDLDGRWHITLDGLTAAGLNPATVTLVKKPADTLSRLREELAEERRRREVAEAVAEERAARIRDLRRLLASRES